jgi:putative hydrolase of the HAD superfamily
VLPVLNLNGHAIHIPYHTTWAYERIDYTIEHPNFTTLKSIGEVLPIVL